AVRPHRRNLLDSPRADERHEPLLSAVLARPAGAPRTDQASRVAARTVARGDFHTIPLGCTVMTEPQSTPDNDKSSEFEKLAEEQTPGLVAEFWDFLIHNKRWWLAPIIIVLLLLGLLSFFAGTGAAPFIYPMF